MFSGEISMDFDVKEGRFLRQNPKVLFRRGAWVSGKEGGSDGQQRTGGASERVCVLMRLHPNLMSLSIPIIMIMIMIMIVLVTSIMIVIVIAMMMMMMMMLVW